MVSNRTFRFLHFLCTFCAYLMIFQSFSASNMSKILWANNSEDISLLFNLIALKPETQVIISDQSLILRTTLLNFMPLSAFFYLQKNLLRMKVFVISEFCVYYTFSVYFRSFVLVLKVGKTQWCNILGHDENFFTSSHWFGYCLVKNYGWHGGRNSEKMV